VAALDFLEGLFRLGAFQDLHVAECLNHDPLAEEEVDDEPINTLAELWVAVKQEVEEDADVLVGVFGFESLATCHNVEESGVELLAGLSFDLVQGHIMSSRL
jgi:hypothetical protein